MSDFFLILNYVAPIFLIVALGYFLKRIGVINDSFVKISSKIVFTIALPALLFMQIINADLSAKVNYELVAFAYIGTFLTFGLSLLTASLLCRDPNERAVFTQGAFRGNYAIIGLALLDSIFGKVALGKGSIVLAFTIPLYNVLAVICLMMPMKEKNNYSVAKTIKEVFTNPLIIGILLAVPFSVFKIKLPAVVLSTGTYLSSMTLPLALLGIGGILNLEDIKNIRPAAIYSSALKIVIFPIIGTYAGYLYGFRGAELGVVFILFGAPTAVASFIMADAMGSDSKLAAGILLITTLFSVITMTIGLYIMKANNLF